MHSAIPRCNGGGGGGWGPHVGHPMLANNQKSECFGSVACVFDDNKLKMAYQGSDVVVFCVQRATQSTPWLDHSYHLVTIITVRTRFSCLTMDTLGQWLGSL